MMGAKCTSSSWRTRCRHVAEERDGACLFKPILYRIFILMDFFNSGPLVLDGLADARERVLCFRSLALAGCNVLHSLSLSLLPLLPVGWRSPDYHTRVSITVRISSARRAGRQRPAATRRSDRRSRRRLLVRFLGARLTTDRRRRRRPNLFIYFP